MEDSDGTEKAPRRYRLVAGRSSCLPYTAQDFLLEVGYTLEEGQSFEWAILSAEGEK